MGRIKIAYVSEAVMSIKHYLCLKLHNMWQNGVKKGED